ncbi:MAG: RNA polymerase sigma factor [Phycisphaerales bacterium]
MARRLEHIQDELLVLRAQDGDADALGELIARWRGPLRAHAWHLVRDRAGVDDIAQEAWMAIVKGLRGLRDPAHFGAWSHRIVGHKCADWIRGRRRWRTVLARTQAEAVGADAGGPVDPAQSATGDEEGAGAGPGDPRMHAALDQLSAEARSLLSLHHVSELNVNQIAAALDIPVGTVKSRLHHARRDLRDAYERTKS